MQLKDAALKFVETYFDQSRKDKTGKCGDCRYNDRTSCLVADGRAGLADCPALPPAMAPTRYTGGPKLYP